MQLLTQSSTEHEITKGLGIIPGTIEAIGKPNWHIGWNKLDANAQCPMLRQSHNAIMYFNHSFSYRGPIENIAAWSYIHPETPPLVAAIHRGSVFGLQFHPEKSQRPGLNLLERLICESP